MPINDWTLRCYCNHKSVTYIYYIYKYISLHIRYIQALILYCDMLHHILFYIPLDVITGYCNYQSICRDSDEIS